MSPVTRPMWAAMLAKFVAPMDAERAGKGLVALVAALSGFPDEAFTLDSAREVASTARILGDGSLAPLTRVPTFGELDLALGRWWRKQVERKAIAAAPMVRLPPPPDWAPAEPNASQDAMDHVRNIVEAYVIEHPTYQTSRALPPEPKPVNPAALLAVYEKLAEQGHRGAATRAAMLRAQLAAAAKPAEAATA